MVVSKGEKHKGLKKTSLIVNHRTQRKSEEKLAVKTKQTKPTFVFRNIRKRKLARDCGAKRQLGYKRCKESKVRLLQIQNKTKKKLRDFLKNLFTMGKLGEYNTVSLWRMYQRKSIKLRHQCKRLWSKSTNEQ